MIYVINFPAVVNVQRGPEVMSQRPSVNEEQKNYALQKAKQYKSKYPITLKIMKETHVYKTFFMVMLFPPIVTIFIELKTVPLSWYTCTGFFSARNEHDYFLQLPFSVLAQC